MPSGPGVIDDEMIRCIASTTPPAIGTFLLTSELTAEGIVSQYSKACTSTIQIVDYIDEADYEKIRHELPWIKLVQVVHVEDETAIERARVIAKYVDGILLDSGKPSAEVKILGGTGKTHNWNISKEIVARSEKPVFLAGGITPENVSDAIEMVHPFGVDVCSGVRTDGRLDQEKVAKLFDEVRN